MLERTLLRELDRVHPALSPGRTLVIVPTRRLVRHVQRRLAGRRPAWLGLEVLHFRSLARRILASSPSPPPRIAPPRLLRALMRRVLAGLPGNGWSEFVAYRPGALGTLLRSLRDLREAGVTPDELDAAAESDGERDLAAVYHGFVRELDSRAGRGWADDAGLIAAALPLAAAYATRYGTILIHGVYEMIGIHLDLLRGLEGGAPVTVLAPFAASGRATAYGREFAERFLAGKSGVIEPAPADDSPDRAGVLSALYDESASPRPSEVPTFRFHDMQGAAAEAQVAARLTLGAIREGCPPDEIVIAARGLTPFVAGLEEVFAELDGASGSPVAWDTSLAAPLRRQPVARELLLLLNAVEQDFPRRAAAELLRSPRIRWEAVAPDLVAPDGERAEPWSREAGLIGGITEWTGDLVDWAARADHREGGNDVRAAARTASARGMGRALEAIRDAVEPGRSRGWAGHAAGVERTLEWFRPRGEDAGAESALGALRQLVLEMRGLVEMAGDERPVPLAEMISWLEEAVDETLLPIRPTEGAGVRVLDVMQLRGLTCRRLFLLGMNSGLFPRVSPPDPVMGDALRRRLRERSGRPLTVRDDAVSEERLLLSLTLGAAAERIDVSWQRADDAGKSKTPSLALRELARVATGRPDTEALLREACHWPSHPLHWLESLERRAGLLNPSEAMILAALRADGPNTVDAGGRFPELAAGLRMLCATESFAPGGAEFDGGVAAAAAPPERFAVTALEILGRCPLRYFFRRVLRVGELEEEADPLQVSPRELGLELHDILDRVYAGLLGDGLFEEPSVEKLVAAAQERLEASWADSLSGVLGRISRRLPLLGEQAVESWRVALAAFVNEDLRRMIDEGRRPAALEELRDCEIEQDDGRTVRVVGRFDRRLAGGPEELIGDYKSSGRLAARGNITTMLKGHTLQVPLYWIMAGAESGVELLGVGPGYDFDDDDAEEAGRLLRFGGFESAKQHEGFLETIRVLLDLVRNGRFPLNAKDSFYCSHCPYDQACRRSHPPTLEREGHARETGNFRDLSKKNKGKLPRLRDLPEDVREGDGGAA